MMFAKGFYLLTAPDNEAGLQYAREYVQAMGFAQGDVRLFRDDGFIYVQTKRQLELKGKKDDQ